jgi:ABC-type branched-subunit amino acid transport system substrate-binding protein
LSANVRGARHRQRVVGLAVVLATSAAVVACGDDGGSEGDAGGGEVSQAAASCRGEPIRLTTIVSESGPLALVGDEWSTAADVAVRDVNEECALGRPLEVDVCDDSGDPNGSTECGRTAASDGSLALLGSVGIFDNGAEAAGLPAVYTFGAGTFDHTSSSSYPVASVVTELLGAVTTADSVGADSAMLATFESPATAFIAEQGEALAEELGLEWDTLFFPQDTTDFAPIAAQIVDADPDSLGVGATQTEPFLQALLAEGWDLSEKPTLSTAGVVPPSVLEALGSDAEGFYLMSSVVPPTEEDNPGIAEMRAAYEAQDVDFSEVSVFSVYMWTGVHGLVDALATLSPDEIEQLDSAALVDAVTGQGPVERPEVVPVDFGQPAFPDNAALSTFRIFSRHAMPTRFEDGRLVPVADFVDVETPFDLGD